MKRRKANSDVIDDAVETGLDLSGYIYQVPYSFFQQGVKASLALKDAVKKKIGLNPAKQNGQQAYVYRWNNGDWRYFMTLNPKREAEWARYVRLSQQQGDKYKIVRSRMNGAKKRNPESGSDAMYESFHGAPPTEDVIIEKEFHEHVHLAGLGDLVECWIETPTGLLAQIVFPEKDRPILSANEDGTQLYIEGGDQEVNLGMLKMDSEEWVKDRMVLGCFALPEGKRKHNISYFTRKDFDQFEDIIYEHDLGEANEGESKASRREAPYLEFEPRNAQLYVTGGQYIIRKPIFETSPGIEN